MRTHSHLSTLPRPFSTLPIEAPADPFSAAGGPVHDLQNLLAVILGICESLADDFDEASEPGELARVGLLATERASRLVATLPLDPRRPCEVATEAQFWPAANAPVRAVGERASVLIVEDDPDLLNLMTQAFLRAGFKAYAAQNGRLGVKLLGALQPDLMVTDIVMPEMEGIATIIEAKRRSPDTRVIAISGGGKYGRSGNFLQWAEELGADEVLAKPFAMQSLIVAARLVIERAQACAPLELRERVAVG